MENMLSKTTETKILDIYTNYYQKKHVFYCREELNKLELEAIKEGWKLMSGPRLVKDHIPGGVYGNLNMSKEVKIG